MRYDVVVVGLGGMGSAILAHSARRGAAVLGLEQFPALHDLGSSHGKSRMIRKAYFEDPAYVPLLLRSYHLWRELEKQAGQQLLKITGLLMVGHRDASVVTGAKVAARQHDLALESLTAPEIRTRFPMLRVRDEEIGVFEPDGGVLHPEDCVRAHLQAAKAAGAEMQFATAMRSWQATPDGFVIRLAEGTELTARRLVLSLGPWFKSELESLGVPIQVQRNVQSWFTPANDQYSAAGGFPCFLLERDDLPSPLYGFPDFGDGVKLAFHGHGGFTDAARLVREIEMDRDVLPVAGATEDWMPGATATFRSATACPYTITSDGHFIVDRHPKHPGLILCGGFSGHGFKFAPVIGEICADLALEEQSRHDIGFLSLQRFTGSNGGDTSS